MTKDEERSSVVAF